MTDPFGRFKMKCWETDNEELSALEFRLSREVPAWFFYGLNVSLSVKKKQMPYLHEDM